MFNDVLPNTRSLVAEVSVDINVSVVLFLRMASDHDSFVPSASSNISQQPV